MKYKYNIKYKQDNRVNVINFKNKTGMIKYLNNNKDKINKWSSPVLNFAAVMLPLKQTVWYNHA